MLRSLFAPVRLGTGLRATPSALKATMPCKPDNAVRQRGRFFFQTVIYADRIRSEATGPFFSGRRFE